MAFKVEETLKSSALSPPPEENGILTKGFVLPEYKGFTLPEYSNPFAMSLSARLVAPTRTGITTLEDAQKALAGSYTTLEDVQKALQSNYQGFASTQQTSEAFKPSPIALMLAESFVKRRREEIDRVLEAMRPTVTAVAGFTQSAALGVQNAQEILRRWITEAARKRASVEELLFAAYEARSAFEKHKPEPILRFLRNRLGTRQPNHAHATALWEVLQIPHEELVGSMMRDERPPAKWLAMRVAFRFGDMRRELDPRDSFAVRTCAKPLAPDQIKKVRGAGIRPDEDGLDPARILARKHGFWQQAIEEIAANGRAINQDRAAIVLKCLELGLDEKECRELLGGDNAWRAFKARAKAEEKKLWEKFEKNYPKPSPNERYLLWKPF